MAESSSIDLIATKLEAAGLGDILALPESQLYSDRVSSYWSDCAKLKPWAIIQPRTTEDVSQVVKTLVDIPDLKFAIRSGGHTYWSGSNNIQDGVTIDLGLMDSIKYDAGTTLASLGPGGQWKFVYAEMEKHNVMVAGGRVGNVGVGGLLLGGGNTFFTVRKGFGCDNVVNYEVVLADGSVVSANKDSNKDLFVALKGGSNNFGIVTRFDMQAFEHTGVWGGVGMYPNTATPQLIDGIVTFTDNLANEPASSLLGFWAYSKQVKDIGVMMIMTNLDGVEERKPFEKILAIPGQVNFNNNVMSKEVAQYEIPPGKQNLWFTLCFKLDARIIKKALEVHGTYVDGLKELVPDGDFEATAVLQPIPMAISKQSVARGGNVFGLDRVKHDSVLLLFMIELPTPELKKAAFDLLQPLTQEIESFADSLDGRTDWRYLNYCNESQDPLGSYGEENLSFLRQVAEKYDPNGVFQHRVPGGFKLVNSK